MRSAARLSLPWHPATQPHWLDGAPHLHSWWPVCLKNEKVSLKYNAHGHHRDLPTFPTRRSSDLAQYHAQTPQTHSPSAPESARRHWLLFPGCPEVWFCSVPARTLPMTRTDELAWRDEVRGAFELALASGHAAALVRWCAPLALVVAGLFEK